jgi:hypothetical protein
MHLNVHSLLAEKIISFIKIKKQPIIINFETNLIFMYHPPIITKSIDFVTNLPSPFKNSEPVNILELYLSILSLKKSPFLK